MAAQIYSRYVPGKKKSTATPNIVPDPSSAAIPSQATPPAATRHDASATYARYVPRPKSKKIDIAVASLSPESTSIPKRKREEVSENIQEPSPKKTRSDGAENAPKQREKKEKRKRKSADIKEKDQERADTAAEGDEDNIRHKSVLEKREKSLRKAEKLAEKAARKAAKLNIDAKSEDAVPEEPPEVHDLGPLPQPEPVPETPFISSTASLLPWMAAPIRVSPTTMASFSDIGVQQDAVKSLQLKGFKEAFAVQAAVLPLLLPEPDQEPGDVVVSAATGSGKTLAYVLPMVQSISENKVTRLRGLIVVPTRELVNQALEVCETCAHAFSDIGRKRVKIGTAVGYQTLKSEQAALIDQELVYNPTKYEAQQRRINAKWENSDWSENENEDEDELLCVEEVPTLLDHVIEPRPKVDILICTPGRLVEHLNSTKGFSLEYVRWLVVDEADKLLDQSFQQWSNAIMSKLPPKPVGTGDRIRKVILSATMARDADQLKSLQLYRPKLVVLEGSSYGQDTDVDADSSEANILPELLIESAIKVEDDADKPLYLLHLLRSQNMIPAPAPDDTSSDDSSSEDDEDDEDDDRASATSSSGSAVASQDKEQSPSAIRVSQSQTQSKTRGVLIFTKSNETAVRLGRLLALLDSSYKIGILTSTTRNSSRKAALKSFQAGRLSILVASDLVSRGLDLPNLAHVVNYDVPKSLTSYVHRVGRTARAGKRGQAWTLLGNTEARWFWNDIARSEVIKRSGSVMRVNINAAVSFGLEQRNKYAEALETLGQEASSAKNNKSNNL